MADVLFNGGPCDGEHADYDDTQAGTGTLSCKGFVYRLYLVEAGQFLALPPGARPPRGTVDTSPPEVTAPDDVNLAWLTFQRKVGRELPHAVNTVYRLRGAVARLATRR